MSESSPHLELPDEPSPAPVSGLAERIPEGGVRDPDLILDLFLDWVGALGFDLYPAQEEALLELMAGRHVILNTPTGSGKSLVALGLHFKALCEGRRSFYTSPIKALASEKFFSLCGDLGAENVGMLTGDASINPAGRVVCCTAEVLANMALRRGEETDAPYVVMDEFHYYSDPSRGSAWQIPLVTLPHTRFLLMSATLGDTSTIEDHLRARTVFEVAAVRSDERPVPLDYEYRETPLHETLQELVDTAKAPVYVVSFTQRECAELAQSLTSMKLVSREERAAILEVVGNFRFDTPYGKELRRFLPFGVGVHHAGLLPKYRLLVEQLAQKGALKVICGTDTLGVGVNVPIRTVLFTKLAKFDGRKVGLLKVRDFKQISGRAGRKGFDDHGSVVVQAPEHVIEKRRRDRKAAAKAAAGARIKRRAKAKTGPSKGEVSWSRETFERLRSKPPETLKSRFRLSHGMLLDLLQRDTAIDDPGRRNFTSLRELIAASHEDERRKAALISHAAVLVRSLHRAGVVRMKRDRKDDYLWVVADENLQRDFSLFQPLSLYLVETLDVLDPEAEGYALSVLSLVEAVLENPRIVLLKQEDKLKRDLIQRLKAEGVPYEERMARLDEVSYPMPEADFIFGSFERFRREHPWVDGAEVEPKGIGREMFEGYLSFTDFVKTYGLQRSEGVLLRYVSQLYKTLSHTVPAVAKTEAVWDALSFFRTMLEQTDTSLLEEWESLFHPDVVIHSRDELEVVERELLLRKLLDDPAAFGARVRSEIHPVVRALAAGDFEEASSKLRHREEDPWDAEGLEEALGPFLEEYGELVFTPAARRSKWTSLRQAGPRIWQVTQVLLDPQGDHLWCLEGEIDLRDAESLSGPLVELRRIGR